VSYYDALTEAMTLLAQDARTLFVGQGVRWRNNAQFGTFANVPEDRRIEFPVAEDFQMGFSLGLAMQGYLPVSVYPRHDFLICAANQLVSHVDRHPITGFPGRVIMRAAVGAKHPLDSGRQHTNDYTAAFRLMLRTTEVIELNCTRDVLPGYRRALVSEHSCLVVERSDLYGE